MSVNGKLEAHDDPSEAFPDRARCPLCGYGGARFNFQSTDRVHHIPGQFGIYRCSACSAYFIQPWLSDAELARYYPESYGRFRVSGSLEKKNYRGWQRFVLEHHYGYPQPDGAQSNILQRGSAALLACFTAKGVIPYRGDGRVLDVGCGSGAYLHRLKQWGWQAYGIEPSEHGALQAQALGLEVEHGMLEAGRYANAYFDVVRLSNVLEHLTDPLAVFREIDRILKPDGLVYITVPNTRSAVFRLFREHWYALETPRHVILYCPKTLETLAQASGFEIANIDFAAGPFNFVRSLNYYFEISGTGWPAALRSINWARSKFLRRAMKPLFFFIDGLGYGDFMHATLRKVPRQVRVRPKLPAYSGALRPSAE